MPLPFGILLHPRPAMTKIHHVHYPNTQQLQHPKTKTPQEAITKCCAHLHHTLAALKRDFPASLVAPVPNSEQEISLHQIIPTIYTKSTPNYIHQHYAPSATHIRHTSSLQQHPHTHHTVTSRFVDRSRWSGGAAGQIER